MGVYKIYDGSQHVLPTFVNHYNGSNFVSANSIKHWDGSQWVTDWVSREYGEGYSGELGGYISQGWSDDSTDPSPITDDTFAGRDCVYINDNTTNLALTSLPITDVGATGLTMYNNGFIFKYSAIPLDTNQCNVGLGFNSNSPIVNGRFITSFSINGSNYEYNIGSYTHTIPADNQWHDIEIRVAPNFGDADVYFDKVLVATVSGWYSTTTSSSYNDNMVMASGSSGGTNRRAYVSDFSYYVE